mmetsp:Transcript_11525/g.19998  ORF Transcript_11525/g.19998 Transcript_11525/m.19998 type:complete len:101 (+) Transcript_11525:182-484(+)
MQVVSWTLLSTKRQSSRMQTERMVSICCMCCTMMQRPAWKMCKVAAGSGAPTVRSKMAMGTPPAGDYSFVSGLPNGKDIKKGRNSKENPEDPQNASQAKR